ncbi:putative allergen [Wickerhamomyces ciferrii]|uniref:Allergen n=1 Tax=Wickerhamomyces ciferrii (strain ATCC 14091 / BCRC 22168 / CBS 111 / JCM 3599 / NBRC 0793 / NRRL Y-1031 F-60-10) TaxID=1206466 RepID=K0KI91_WICCF|nr:putative allergen [Wickerhamomyces ciferrii]CCH41119.1 putative allergen [Wickerhamomyces ciferrii]
MKFSVVLSLLPAIALAQSSSQSQETSTIWVEAEETDAYQWDADWYKDYPIHSSCNRTKYNQLVQAFQETKQVAAHARDHTLRYSNNSEIYRKYFGNAPSGEVVGWFSNVVDQDKTGLLFRCDNPDGNCNNSGWAGHWRGENGTDETVICDLSFNSRLWISQLCSRGYRVSKVKDSVFWAGDLLHRIWHTSIMGQNVVGHYADTYDEILELALTNEEEAVRNSATLRYYALEVYAYDIAVPGVGCSGEDEEEEESSEQPTSSTQAEGGTECHTHADGETHCV